MREEPDTEAAKDTEAESANMEIRRMTWPDAVALLAIASVVCWIVIASVFLGVTFDPNTVAEDRDIKDLLEFAPAAGPEPEAPAPESTPAPQAQ